MENWTLKNISFACLRARLTKISFFGCQKPSKGSKVIDVLGWPHDYYQFTSLNYL